jgi:hypothetical protein
MLHLIDVHVRRKKLELRLLVCVDEADSLFEARRLHPMFKVLVTATTP